jgi:hypothetical protein
VTAPTNVAWVRPELASWFTNTDIRAPGRSSRSSSRGRQTRTFSRKSGRTIRGNSSWEARHALDTDFDITVEWMVEQPLALRYGAGRIHKPDAFVAMRRGSHEIREVKEEIDAVIDEEKWEQIGKTVAAMGYAYRVVTEHRLLHPPRSANISLLLQDRHTPLPDDNQLEEIWTSVGDRSFTIDELEASFPYLERKCVHALIRALFFAIEDLDEPLDGGTRLTRFRRKVMRIGGSFLRT